MSKSKRVCNGLSIPTDSFTSYVLVDEDWNVVCGAFTDEDQFRFNTIEEAKAELKDAAHLCDLSVKDIFILEQIRRVVA